MEKSSNLKHFEWSILHAKKWHFLAEKFNRKTSKVFPDTGAANICNCRKCLEARTQLKHGSCAPQGWGRQADPSAVGPSCAHRRTDGAGCSAEAGAGSHWPSEGQSRFWSTSRELLQQRRALPATTRAATCGQLPVPPAAAAAPMLPKARKGLVGKETLESQGLQTTWNKTRRRGGFCRPSATRVKATGSSVAGMQTSAFGNTANAALSTATVNVPQSFAKISNSVADCCFFFKFYYTKESNKKAKATYPSHCTEGSEMCKYFLMHLISAAKNRC